MYLLNRRLTALTIVVTLGLLLVLFFPARWYTTTEEKIVPIAKHIPKLVWPPKVPSTFATISTTAVLFISAPAYTTPVLSTSSSSSTTPVSASLAQTTTSIAKPTPLPTQYSNTNNATSNSSSIPEKLWYKLGPRGLTSESESWIKSCTDQNPTYSVTYLNDTSASDFVHSAFASHPEIVSTYHSLPLPIHKADFLRYLLLYQEGGIYNDLDVSCGSIPMREWVPVEYRQKANLIVGWEFDIGWGENIVREFATWTILAKPKSTHLMAVINDIISSLHAKTLEYDTSIPNLTMAQLGDVVDLTGPRRMTRSVLNSVRKSLGGGEAEGDVMEKGLFGIEKPKLVGDVLVLPAYSLAWESNHYKTADVQGPRLVTHHGAGSWKNEKGGETVDDDEGLL